MYDDGARVRGCHPWVGRGEPELKCRSQHQVGQRSPILKTERFQLLMFRETGRVMTSVMPFDLRPLVLIMQHGEVEDASMLGEPRDEDGNGGAWGPGAADPCPPISQGSSCQLWGSYRDFRGGTSRTEKMTRRMSGPTPDSRSTYPGVARSLSEGHTKGFLSLVRVLHEMRAEGVVRRFH